MTIVDLVFITILTPLMIQVGTCQSVVGVVSPKATTPITWEWRADDQPLIVHTTNETRDTVVYCWNSIGYKDIVLSVSNTVSAGKHTQRVFVGYIRFMPWVRR